MRCLIRRHLTTDKVLSWHMISAQGFVLLSFAPLSSHSECIVICRVYASNVAIDALFTVMLICLYNCPQVVDFVRKGHQVMVFVHARNATVRTGMKLMETANNRGHSQLFLPEDSPQYGQAQKSMSKSRNKQVRSIFWFSWGLNKSSRPQPYFEVYLHGSIH